MDKDGLHPKGLSADHRTSRHISLDEVDNAVLLDGIALWKSLCAGKKYPSRSAVTPRAIKLLLRHTMLVRVIDGGADYDYRIVGDAYVMAHGTSFQGRKWSELRIVSPGFQKAIKGVYDRVVQDGAPVATRGWIERGAGSSGHVYSEYVFLPLGEETTGVDHILIFAVYVRRDGLEHVGAAIRGSFAG